MVDEKAKLRRVRVLSAEDKASYESSLRTLESWSFRSDTCNYKPMTMPLLVEALRKRGPIRHEHDLADDTSLAEPLLRLSRVGKRKSLRDYGLYLLLLKKLKERCQILSEQGRS